MTQDYLLTISRPDQITQYLLTEKEICEVFQVTKPEDVVLRIHNPFILNKLWGSYDGDGYADFVCSNMKTVHKEYDQYKSALPLTEKMITKVTEPK